MDKKEAIDKVLKELQDMPDEELEKALEKARESDIYKALVRAWEGFDYDYSGTTESGSKICHEEAG